MWKVVNSFLIAKYPYTAITCKLRAKGSVDLFIKTSKSINYVCKFVSNGYDIGY